MNATHPTTDNMPHLHSSDARPADCIQHHAVVSIDHPVVHKDHPVVHIDHAVVLTDVCRTAAATVGASLMRHACAAAVLMAVLTGCLTTSCSDDAGAGEEPQPVRYVRTGPIVFGGLRDNPGVTWVDGRVAPMGDRCATRAEGDVESDIPDNIGVFAFGDGRNTTYVFRNQRVYYRDGREFYVAGQPRFDWTHTHILDGHETDNLWPYTTDESELSSVQKLWEPMHYRFFAYSPWSPNDEVSVEGENYANFTTFRWENIPGFSAHDYVLADSIVNLDNTGDTFTTKGNAVHFTMRHILSRLRFFVKMAPAYRQIRAISLDTLTVLTAGHYKSATFNFRNDAWDETVHWSHEEIGDAKSVDLVNNAAGEYMLPTAYPAEPFGNIYVYPQDNFSNLRLRIKYTVYDSQGVATRHAEVTNEITPPAWTLLSGYYYDIFINVVPTYLYVMSENDQDFDGWVIIDDKTTPTDNP